MLLRWRWISYCGLKLSVVDIILEGIRYPVGDEARDAPFPRMSGDGIKIFVRPERCSLVSLHTSWMCNRSYHRAFPSAKVDLGCSTLSAKCGFSIIGIASSHPNFERTHALL
jgi:hypothetical protein